MSGAAFYRRRRRVLDVYCCEGGAHRGYTDAGFDVYGIDLFEDFTQSRYPGASYKGDAIHALVLLLAGQQLPFTHRDGTVEWLGLADFDLIHASPPCQHASAGTRALRKEGAKEYPKLVEPTRYLLEQTGLPWVIENVKGAALLDPVVLCGSMFDLGALDEDGLPLRLERHRMFETNFPLDVPRPCHHDPDVWAAGVYGGSRLAKRPKIGATPCPRQDREAARYDRKGGYVPRSLRVRQELLGIDWMTGGGMAQSIPPAYAEWVGLAALAHIEGLAAA